MSFQPYVKLWIWISAFATLAGWALSAVGELNQAGYVFAFIILIFFLFFIRKGLAEPLENNYLRPRKILRRFCRLLPFCFGVFAILIFLSGLVYAPDNYTGLTYRLGRILQWLSHDHWVWIHTPDFRMNDRACGMEWLMAPVILFTHSTRSLFLFNFLPFLLLPGLIFSIFTRLGVARRVAWEWMWLLPTGYIFILQAGSVANDTFPTVYALAAIDFALRAAGSKKFSDTANSILAAALLTGAKASNLPLLLPWAILMLPLLAIFKKRIVSFALVVLLAAAVSFLPTAVLNIIHCGGWSGAVLEPSVFTVNNPLIAVTGNGFQLLLDNLAPPIFPEASWWNAKATHLVPQALVTISKHFDNGFFVLGELPTEDSAGIGFGLCLLLAISLGGKFFQRKHLSRTGARPSAFQTLILTAPWLALLAYCAKSGLITACRLIAPYYPLLLPLLLIGPAGSVIVRKRWWQILVHASLFLALLVLVLTPARPLWPAQAILSRLVARHPDSHSLTRAYAVYSIYARRADPLADVRALLPPDVKRVGFLGTSDDCDFSFWLPLGSRKVEHFLLSDPPQRFHELEIQYAVVGGLNLKYQHTALDDWLKKTGAQLVGTTNATQKVVEGSQPWYVVRINP